MEIDNIHIDEQDFDIFLNLQKKDKIAFVSDTVSYGIDAAMSRLQIFEPEDEIEFEADFDIDDGEFLMSMRRFIPDYKQIVGNSLISLFISDFPSETQTVSPLGPFTVTSTTKKIDTRARGRLLSVKIENESVGETWRYGSLRLDAQPDGRR